MINRLKTSKYYIIHFFKINFLKILGIFVISSFLIALGTIMILVNQSSSKSTDLKDTYIGKHRYTMIDNFYDPDAFYEFRQNYKNINTLAEFYNKLSKSTKLTLLSISAQPIQLQNYLGDNRFYYNTEEFIEQHKDIDIAVKSLQINKLSFDFYNLKIKQGKQINWNEISYNNESIPILLGSDYIGIYDIGDNIIGNFYGKNKTFEVYGFLEKNSFLYYKNTPEFYLDKYIIIPYPSKVWEVNEKDFVFEGILYFSLVNCDIITSLSESSFIEEIKSIANSSGFIDFSIVGIDDFKIKYQSLISIIKENQNILYLIFMFIYILIIFILYSLGRIILTKKYPLYALYWLIGDKSYKTLFLKDIGLTYTLAFMLTFIIQRYLFQGIFLQIILIQFLILLSIFIPTYYFCNKLLIRNLIKD